MKKQQLTFVIIFVLLLIGAIYFFAFKNSVGVLPPENTTCPLDALVCPDGSTVGRSGPNCEFSACPN